MELFRLVGKLAIEGVNEAKSDLDGVTDKAESSGNRLTGTFKKIGAAVGAAFVVKQVTDFGAALTTLAVQGYADYEQLTGGIDTLFKDSYDKVIEYAANAYKTSGVSANEYMETVTSFSASLLQSLGGDTSAAAEVANMALTDMSDNANKMGTSMEMIQNAYQGFSKQNYTMLDNLKLGYGGTQEEMKRLLADAEKISGVKYDISSLNDVYQAIHVIQTEIGITGTTAAEAESTISGSVASMKAAWQNLLVGFAAGDQNIDVLVNNFASSLITAAQNVIPRVFETFKSLGSVLINNIVGGFAENTPQILEKGRETLTNFAQGFSENLPVLIDNIGSAITSALTYLKENAPQFLAMGAEFIIQLGFGVIKSIPTIIENVLELTGSIIDTIINTDWSTVGKAIIEGIGDGLASMGSWLIEKAKGIGQSIIDGITGSSEGEPKKTSSGSSKSKSKAKVKKNAEGGILTKPTIFGYTPATNTYQLGGEAGAEAIAPISVLQDYVEASVAKVMDKQTVLLQGILNAIAQQKTGEMTAVVQLDGRAVAKSVFKPLQDITKQHGKSLVAT